jgi:multimeric flavodoxin WrbA
MKILNVYGSSIDGSSAAIAKYLVAKALSHGAEVESIWLGRAHIENCRHCMSCKTVTDRCVIEDGLGPVFASLATCDVLVLSTGVYGGDAAGNACIFEARLFSLLTPDFETSPQPSRLSPGKTLVFIQTQDYGKEEHVDLYERFTALFRKLGFDEVFVIHADNIDKPSDLRGREDILGLADEIATKVVLGITDDATTA